MMSKRNGATPVQIATQSSRPTSSQTVTAAFSNIPAKFHWPADSKTLSPFMKCDVDIRKVLYVMSCYQVAQPFDEGIGEHMNHRRRWLHLR